MRTRATLAELPIVKPEELSAKTRRELWDGLDEESKRHPLIMDDGVLRFQPNPAICWCVSKTNLNDLWEAGFEIRALKELYRHMGYSLCGFREIFEDKA